MMIAATACAAPAPADDQQQRPNWHQDIAPIVHAHCVSCHREDGVAPMQLDSYASAAAWAAWMSEAVLAQTMPPWGAQDTPECRPTHAWVNDVRLSDAQQHLIADWAELGAPEGDPELAAPLPAPPDNSLADPSDIFEVPAPIAIPDQVDSFACVSIDPGLDEDVWVTGVELLPGNEQVVHHALIMLDPSGASAAFVGPDGTFACDSLHLGSMLGSYFPGSGATLMPVEVGVPFPIGARIVINFHYHPTAAGGDLDQSSIAVRWTSQPPSHDALISTVGNATTAAGGLLPGPNDAQGEPVFKVPAGAKQHTETMQITVPWVPDATRLFMLGPHMHRVGTDIRMTITREGETQCLIQDPRWDPNWQSVYVIDGGIEAFPTVAIGDTWTLRCTYDNSMDNPEVVAALDEYGLDAPITVSMGSAALDEMCMFVYALAIPR